MAYSCGMNAHPAFPVTPDFKPLPYWWDAAPRVPAEPPPLPARADVAIVGSGITGLVAAMYLARGGRHVVVLDQGDLGVGASTRNAGYIGRLLKHGFGEIAAAKGLEAAKALYGGLQEAFDTVLEIIREEEIDCGFVQCGRYTAAPTPRHYERMARELELRRKHLGWQFEMIPRARQHTQIATDFWHGGAVIPDLAALHPGRYHQGLLERARAAGAGLHGQTRVEAVAREGGEIVLRTDRGRLVAREAIVATNGYTGPATPWAERRLLPFNAFMVATEPLASDRMRRLLPTMRTVIDDGRNGLFVRPSPDGTRLLFGGHTGRATTEPLDVAPGLYRALLTLLPDLAGVRLSHAWTGRCAGTWDIYPHIGRHDGIHYAMGYCFAGIPMGSYMGGKLAARILGRNDTATPFDRLDFRPVPLRGLVVRLTPWLLRYWEWRDSVA